MQRVLAQLEADAAAALAVNIVPVRRRRRGRGGGADSDGEVEDVLPNGMALAVFNEQYDAVAELLLRGVDAAALDRGERPLLLALLRNERPDVAELLVAAGAEPAGVVAHGLSPLHWLAQRNGDAAVLTPLVTLLVRAGADVEARELIYGAAPLAWAGWHGCAGPAAALLSVGADPRSEDAFQGTAGHWAVLNGHAEAAEVLRVALRDRPADAPAAVRTSAEDAAAYKRSLQTKHAARLEGRARGDAAVRTRLLSLACEEATGFHAPGPVRQRWAALLLREAFTLWEPATQPRV